MDKRQVLVKDLLRLKDYLVEMGRADAMDLDYISTDMTLKGFSLRAPLPSFSIELTWTDRGPGF